VAPFQDVFQFDFTGLIQSAIVDTPSDVRSGGRLTVNGHEVIVPSNTIVTLPAFAITWQELFALAPSPYGLTAVPPSTGLALQDLPKPYASYEVRVVGNVVVSCNAQGESNEGSPLFVAPH
jgi:hypothetical protein